MRACSAPLLRKQISMKAVIQVVCLDKDTVAEIQQCIDVYIAEPSSSSVQANKPAIIESTDGKYPPISAEDFVRESLRAIYVKSEA